MKTHILAGGLLLLVLLLVFTQGCTEGLHQVSSRMEPAPGVQGSVSDTPGPSGTLHTDRLNNTSNGIVNRSMTFLVPGGERMGDVYKGDILHVEGETILSPGNRLIVVVEQPEFGPTSKYNPADPTGGSQTVVVMPGESGSMNRYEAEFPTRGWNCGNYTISVTGIDVPVRDEHPLSLLCRD